MKNLKLVCLRTLVGLSLASAVLSCASAPPVEKGPSIFFPNPPSPPRIQFLRSVSGSGDVEDGRSSLDALLFGDQEYERNIQTPYGVMMHQGVLYVCDPKSGAVLTMDFEEGAFGFVNIEGRGGLSMPNNITVDEDGTFYVADMGRRQVVAFDEEYKFIAEYGPFGENSVVVDVEVFGNLIYAVDKGTKSVHVVDKVTGDRLFEFGQLPLDLQPRAVPIGLDDDGPEPDMSLPTSLRGPTNVTVTPDGLAYVVDSVASRIFVYDQKGKFLRYVGVPGQSYGCFARPKGLGYFDEHLYIVDAAFENCQIFDLKGEPLMFFGGGGVDPGKFYMPSGLWIGTDGLDLFEDYLDDDFTAEALIAVASQFGPRKVSFFALGKSSNFEYED